MSQSQKLNQKDEKIENYDGDDEIFKSLSHKIRREIIKILGDRKSLSFTEIKNELSEIDSPTLSYHLKSLKLILKQDKNLYFLTDVGIAALNLIDRIDQSERMKKGKRRFFIANWVTVICWSIIMFLIPFSVRFSLNVGELIFLSVSLNLVGQINFQVNWQLFGRTYRAPKKAPKTKKKKKK